MTMEEIKKLIEKYEESRTTLQEEQALRDYFQQGDIPDEFQSVADQFRYFEKIGEAEPSNNVDPFSKIDFEKESASKNNRTKLTPALSWSLRVAAGFALLIIGFAAGHFLNVGRNSSGQQINPKIQAMKATLVNPANTISAGKRLSVINISDEFTGRNQNLDKKVTTILTYTMNNDDNVNVRLAAAGALFKYRNDVSIKTALIHSLARQSDPLMQITLINMLVKLKAKEAIPAMQELLVSTDTRKIVRRHLKIGIAELQA